MLHPVGSLPASVYWRRRVFFFAAFVAAVVLAVLTVRAFGPGSESHAVAVVSHSSTPTPTPTPITSSPSASPSSSTSSAATTPSSSAPADSATPAACAMSQLNIEAAAQAATYKVGDEPVVMLQVTNVGPANCTTDLADPKIQLLIYNGAARVWGSHDCKIQPGTDIETLVVGVTVAKAIQWSGLSSQPACAGTRQQVGPGVYTVYAQLDGVQGTAAQFTIS